MYLFSQVTTTQHSSTYYNTYCRFLHLIIIHILTILTHYFLFFFSRVMAMLTFPLRIMLVSSKRTKPRAQSTRIVDPHPSTPESTHPTMHYPHTWMLLLRRWRWPRIFLPRCIPPPLVTTSPTTNNLYLQLLPFNLSNHRHHRYHRCMNSLHQHQHPHYHRRSNK